MSMFVDGLSNAKGSGAEILLKSSNDDLVEHSLSFGFQAPKNEAKYETLIMVLGFT